MSEELDLNKVAAEFVTQNLERFYDTGKGVIKGAADAVRLRLRNSYSDYLSCVTERHSKAKSFFIRNDPTYLYDFYIPLAISSSKGKMQAASFLKILEINKFAVVTGGGGSGKSMLMRHLLLDTIKEGDKVPVFVELRELNQTDQDLTDLIYATLESNHFSLDADYVEKAMKAGHFAFFFDGYDEITRALRNPVGKQIQRFAKSYDQNAIVLSSRPDVQFAGWGSFTVFSIDALTVDKACDLVEKLPFDSELKSKFLKDLKRDLFEKHTSFLSNPLLLSIMLLTYGESAGIPNKTNIFYNQAYEALFQRHDALKGGFQRDRSTNLDIQDFAKVFSAFSLLTYDKRLFQFSRSDAVDYLEKCKSIINLEFNSELYLTDCLQAVSLLIEEGLLVVFSHRSFQEYFVARFICNSVPNLQERLLARYVKNLDIDNVIKLLYEMNSDLVERILIIPGIEKLEQSLRIKRNVGITHFVRFLKKQFVSILIAEDNLSGGVGVDKQFFGPIITFALNECGHLVGWHGFDYQATSIWKKYGNKTESVDLPIASLSVRSELVRDLAASNTWFSINTLQSVFDIKKALIKKHQKVDRSLEDLLKGK